MKNKLKTILAAVAVLTIIFGTQAFANSTTATYTLPKNTWYNYICYKSTNTDKFDYSLIDVWPDDSSIQDTYTRVKMGLKDADGNWLMSERVVTEDWRVTVSYNYAGIKNLSTRDIVYFTLRGNNPSLGAKATIYTNYY